jgi:hypothetical protein
LRFGALPTTIRPLLNGVHLLPGDITPWILPPSLWSCSSMSMVIIFFLVLVVPILVIILLEFYRLLPPLIVPFHGNHFLPSLGCPLPSDHLFEFWHLFLFLVLPFLVIISLSFDALFLVLVVPFLVIVSLSFATLFLVLVVPFLVIISFNCLPLPGLGRPLLGDPPPWIMVPFSPLGHPPWDLPPLPNDPSPWALSHFP